VCKLSRELVILKYINQKRIKNIGHKFGLHIGHKSVIAYVINTPLPETVILAILILGELLRGEARLRKSN